MHALNQHSSAAWLVWGTGAGPAEAESRASGYVEKWCSDLQSDVICVRKMRLFVIFSFHLQDAERLGYRS